MKKQIDKLEYWLWVIVIFCGVLSVVAVSISAYYSGHIVHLYKLSLPAIIIIIAIVQIRSHKRRRII
ncbi:MAG: hypothetical protein IPJ81_09730 [Chitinophagaceae bacterium]|nr:hypothetical protein [Chitinophagaceae bacterium]